MPNRLLVIANRQNDGNFGDRRAPVVHAWGLLPV
jgi:hypothetical protein